MTTYVFGTAIVTLAVASNLQEMSRRLDKPHCGGMFTSALSASGTAPATHYISSGLIPQFYAQTIANNVLLFNRAKAAWEADGDVFPYTQLQVTTQLALCDISQDPPFEAMARMGLRLVQPPTA